MTLSEAARLLSYFVRRPEDVIEGVSYIIEWDGTEYRLPDVAAVGELLSRAAAAGAAELWVFRDRGPRYRNWLGRLLGTPARDIEPCFWLATADGVAVLTFLDGAWSEYRSVAPSGPAAATENQRSALSCGEPTPASPEVCLRADQAFEAAVEYLARDKRPDWLVYQYVR